LEDFSVKKKHVLESAIILLIIILGLTYIYINRSHKDTLTYINAIDNVYDSNINGMVVSIIKTNNLYGRNAELISTVGGNKDNNFSANNKEGVKLWEAKQLFLSVKSLKVVRKGLPEILQPEEISNYIIQTNQDFYGKDATKGIYYLALYINSKNYHIYIPKSYYEPSKLLNVTTEYVEYEPNEITKKLVNDIIAQ
jgi:hypothetical protein